MNPKWQKPARRMLALLLCVASLIGMFPMLELGANAAADPTKPEALDLGAAGYSSVLEISGLREQNTAIAGKKPTSSPKFSLQLIKTGDSIDRSSLLGIRSTSGYFMSYDPLRSTPASSTGSFKYDGDGDSLGTIYNNGDIYYMDHSLRNDALWYIMQLFSHNGSHVTSQTGSMSFSTGAINALGVAPLFNNGRILAAVSLQKGKTDSDNKGFWYNNGDNGSKVFRHLGYRSDSVPFCNTNAMFNEQNGHAATKDVASKFIIEMVANDECIIYYNNGNSDLRVLGCDEKGTWSVTRYSSEQYGNEQGVKNAVWGNPEHRLNLFKYVTENANKNVAYKGYTEFDVVQGISDADLKNAIYGNLTVFDPDRNNQHVPGENDLKGDGATKAGYYWLRFPSGFSTSTTGTKTVDIVYNALRNDTTLVEEVIGTIQVNVHKVSYSIDNLSGMVSKNAGDSRKVYPSANSETPAYFTATANGKSTQVTITLGMLRTSTGERVDTSKPETYRNLVLTHNGKVVTKNFTIKVGDSTLKADLPKYPAPGSVDVDKVATTSQDDFFKNGDGNGVANIQLSVKGKNSTKGVDLVIIMDLSSSMRYAVDGNTEVAANNTVATWNQTRLYKMEQALKTMITSMQEDKMDVRIAMADFGDLDHFEFEDAVLDKAHRNWPQIEMVGGQNTDVYAGANVGGKFYAVNYNTEIANQLNFVLGKNDKTAADEMKKVDKNFKGTSNNSQTFYLHPNKYSSNLSTFTGKILPKVYTGSKNVSPDAFVDIHTLTESAMTGIIKAIDEQNQKMIGTNYDVGLEYAYRLAYARQQENIAAGDDRIVTCIFMSDGAAMQYNYFSGRAQSEAWSQYLVGNTDEIISNHEDAVKWNINDFDTLHPGLRWTIERMRQMMHAGKLWVATHDNDTAANGSGNHNPNGANGVGLVGYANGGTDSNGNALYWAGPAGDNCGAPASNGDGADFVGAFSGHNAGYVLDLYDLFELIYRNRSNPALYAAPNPFGTNETGTEFNYQRLIQFLREPGYTDDTYFMAGATNNWSIDENGNVISGINTLFNERYQHQTYSPYWYFYNTEGKNWWAEAIKGDTNQVYPVINRHAGKTTGEWSGEVYTGEVPNKFNGTTAPTYMRNKQYISGFKGLGLDIYTVGFAITADDHMISVDEALTVLQNVATRPAMFYNTTDTEDLTDALNNIIDSATGSASGSWFTDTMGSQYDLLTSLNSAGKNATPVITLKEYEVNADGTRGKLIKTWETITFGGKNVAYLNGGTKDIWDADGGIRGDYLYFNTNSAESRKTISLENLRGTGLNYTLAPETFFWSVGNVKETEMVLEYQVYLNGSTEGTLSNTKTFYDTNEEAIFNYKDELGNMVNYDTVSPEFYWYEGTSYTYAIYLVDDNGMPIRPDGSSASSPSAAVLASSGAIELNITSNPTNTYVYASDAFTELGINSSLYELYNPTTQVVITSQTTQQRHDMDITDQGAAKTTTYVGNSKTDKTGLNNAGVASNTIYFAVKLKDFDALVNYGIYLVDGNGNPINPDGTPASDPAGAEVDSGSADITVTNDPTKTTVTVEDIFTELGLNPDLYEIYSPNSQVEIISDKVNKTHDMDLTDGTNPKTTYVGSGKTDKIGLDTAALADNKIWFAVKLKDFDAMVNYGIYLVDGNGNPINADGTPASGPAGAEVDSGSASITVSDDLTKNTFDVEDIFAELGLNPDLYEIYSPNSQVEITSDKAQKDHDMVITDNADPKTTYVGDGMTNKESVSNDQLDDNKIWFAVKLKDFDAKVNYGIYLVDGNGNPIKTDGTPASGPSGAELDSGSASINVADDTTKTTLTAEEILKEMGLDPDVYELYSPDSKVEITSDKAQKNHDVVITDNGDPKTTYVGNDKSDKEDLDNDELDDSKVWFAVKLKDFDATVNYGIYLVDGSGNPIKTDGTPTSGPAGAEVGSGSTTITVADDPTKTTIDVEDIFEQLGLNSDLYEIYSPNTQVEITSDKANRNHDMDITDNGDPKTTYVGADKTSKENVNNDLLDDSKIWFAVKLKDFDAMVNYGIYLVDGNGNPIKKDGQPATTPDDATLGSGSSAINVTEDITKTTITAEDVLKELGLNPDHYEIYSPGTKVDIFSDKAQQNHDLDITDGTDPKTTFVGADKTDKDDLDNNGLSNNKINFAVKLKNRGSADVVVVDYGLPVDIDVLANDGFGDKSTLVGYQTPAGYGAAVTVPNASSNLVSNAVNTLDDNYATVVISNNLSRWQAKDMKFSNYYQYAYCAQDSATGHHYWSSVTVIPATSIYYEDSFVSFNEGDLTTDGWSWAEWKTEGTAIDGPQNQDRPGSQGQNIDADKIYGYDDAYKSTTTYSGGARWTQVTPNSPARASFTFTGTGFDVISLSSSKTGSVMVFVYKAEDFGNNGKFDDPSTVEYDGTVKPENVVQMLIVNSYYSLEDSLYQVPVIKVNDLAYGTYVVELLVAYDEWFAEEKHDDGKFDFYLDSIRIYNPAGIVSEGKDDTIYDAYTNDGERWPRYQELRNMILAPEVVDGKVTSTEDISGMLFIDSRLLKGDEITYSNYASWGPNNELYMKTDDMVYFKLNTTKYLNEAFNDADTDELANVDKVHIAMRALSGTSKVKISGGSKVYEYDVSATDMYYDITGLANENVTIQVTGDAAVSITNIKVTHTAMPDDYLAELGQAKARRTMALKSTVLNVNAPSMASLITVNGEMAAELLDELNKDESTDAVITAKYASLSFKDLIHTNVYFEVNGINAENVGLAVFAGNEVDGTVETAAYVVNGASVVNGMYRVSTKGIPAKNLGDTIFFKIFAIEADGSVSYTKLLTYSALEYANYLLTSGSDMDKTLAAAMLNYGAEAQKYFGYKTDALMNASVTAEAQTLLAGYSISDLDALDAIDSAKAGVFTANGGFDKKYPSVSFKGAFQINYYFQPSAAVDGDVTFYYWTEDTCNAVNELTADNADGTTVMTAENGVYSATSGAIFAKNLDKTVYVAATYVCDGVTYCTGILPYSVAEYARAFADSTDAFAPFANATGIYGSVAKAYFGN